jgi:hypothetical protein
MRVCGSLMPANIPQSSGNIIQRYGKTWRIEKIQSFAPLHPTAPRFGLSRISSTPMTPMKSKRIPHGPAVTRNPNDGRSERIAYVHGRERVMHSKGTRFGEWTILWDVSRSLSITCFKLYIYFVYECFVGDRQCGRGGQDICLV